MKAYEVTDNQWKALNQKGSHKPQTDFAATLQRATSKQSEMSLLQLPSLNPLTQGDFESGDSALPPSATHQLNQLTAHDFGGSEPAALHPLTHTDYIPGAQVAKNDADSKIREQTEKWVGETFYGNLLKQMHDSPFKSKLFDGGRGAEAFEPMLDQQISDHIAQSKSNKLVESVVRDIESKMKKGAGRSAGGQKPSGIPAMNNPYWNERAHVAPGIRA